MIMLIFFFTIIFLEHCLILETSVKDFGVFIVNECEFKPWRVGHGHISLKIILINVTQSQIMNLLPNHIRYLGNIPLEINTGDFHLYFMICKLNLTYFNRKN